MFGSILSWPGLRRKRTTEADTDTQETTGGDDMGPVCIGSVEGPLRAEIARTYLEDAGLTVYLQSEAAGKVYGLIMGPLAVVQLYVPASQAEEARQVFAELEFDDMV
ncbi:MAG: hypothetical protein GFH27_549319n43 [Chloroflexi bacterium AL-W]|nr:hypothetical protein [Chloroflexi bacterium AL-N1]NOK70589.1 hypothetical protein [Chloroflexi bacterium AL-N10]NOK77581.1 hypothetical protein [Chloroflexi bacterium AL-N5]NOK84432.1 hypothetical protein [Chloroflexi bacterium AL-W]NOK92321.1 hypothetical protein [Chloroflexi bacterium AL-N15]